MPWWWRQTSIIPPTERLVGRWGEALEPALETGEEGAAGRSCPPPGGKEAFRTRNRSVRRTAQRLHRIARRKGEGAKKELKEAYHKLIAITQARRVVKALRGHADYPRAGRLLESFEHLVPLVERGIAQATRRVLEDEQVSADEKILSLFEEHTRIITRQKMGKPREFGRKVLIDEVDGGIVSRYEILEEVGREHPHLPASLEAHPKRFGRAPYLLGRRSRPLLGRERAAGS
jgi:transposase, IS5 family